MGREASTCRRSGKPPASVQKSNVQESRIFTKNLGDKGALAGVRVSRIKKNKRLRFFLEIRVSGIKKSKKCIKTIVSNFFRSVVIVFFFYSFALSLVFLLWFPSSFSVAETAEFYNCCCRHDECSMGSEKATRLPWCAVAAFWSFVGVLFWPFWCICGVLFLSFSSLACCFCLCRPPSVWCFRLCCPC